MKPKSRNPFNAVGTAAAAVVAVAAASSQSLLDLSPLSTSTVSSNYEIQNHRTILDRIPRGGGEQGSSDSSAQSQKPTDNRTDAGSKNSSQTNKKKKSRPPSNHSTPPETKSHDTSSVGGDTQPSKPHAPTPIQSYISTEKDLYNILGLHQQPRSSITETEIQKAYRRRCLLTHPDKVPNGDQGAFDKVTEAFNILSDSNKRSLYDKFGIDAVKDGDGLSGSSSTSGMTGGMGEEILRQFFGGNPTMDGMRFFPSGSRQDTKPKNRNLRYQLEVSLEDMYTGTHQSVTIAQPYLSSKKVLQVTIPRGILHGQAIRLPGEVDHVAGSTPADVIFILVQRKHPTFTRKANDLAMEVTLNLSEALCGFERVITHLDGRKLYLRGPVLEGSSIPVVIQSGDVHVLKGEGMPKRFRAKNIPNHDVDEKDRCQHFGDLYVQFKVDLPSSDSGRTRKHIENHLSMEERTTLRNLLNKLQGTATVENGNPEKVQTLKTASPSDFGRASGPIESNENDDGGEDNESEDSFRQGFRYFSSSGPGRSGFFSSSTASTDENGNVQCQQM